MPPSFLEDRRRAALEVYEPEPMPTWRRSGFWTTSLRNLALDDLEPRHYDGRLAELPGSSTSPRDEELGGADRAARRERPCYGELDPELAEQGVILISLEKAAEEHPELRRAVHEARCPIDEGKFPAATAAFWTGGVFLHVPRA